MSIHVKPSKIISGLEPERTRYLLQLFTVVATTKCLTPTGSVDVTHQEPPKSEVSFEEPLNEESKETIDLVHGNEKENVSPNDDSCTKSFSSNSPPPEAEVQSKAPEEATVESPTSNMERPATSRGGIPSIIKERKDEPTSVIRPTTATIKNEDDSEFEVMSLGGTHTLPIKSAGEEKIEDLSIFQKIIQEQKLNKSRDE